MTAFPSGEWVFDLDGTLVDTREAVRRAYEYAGVTMPADAWGRPWHEWLTGPDASRKHAVKNQVYMKTLGLFGRPLPLLQLVEEGGYPVITGASHIAVETIIIKWAPRLNVALRQATLEDKVRWLGRRVPGAYVDDDVRCRQIIEEKTRWQVLTPEECLRLFSPRAPTSA